MNDVLSGPKKEVIRTSSSHVNLCFTVLSEDLRFCESFCSGGFCDFVLLKVGRVGSQSSSFECG